MTPRIQLLLSLGLLFLTCVTSEEGDPLAGLTSKVNSIEEMIKALDHQVTRAQLYVDEQTRAQGQSGIKQQRIRNSGTRPYYSESFVGEFFADFHDHPNFRATIGIGEIVAVLNGQEFRTRHNDYDLVQPSLTSSDYHAVDRIPFPDVPPEVSAKSTIREQVVEMKNWFKAWQEQNATVRDYTKYFKPVVTYLEGAWTFSGEEVDEPFYSTRHKIEADTWDDLEEEVRFLGYSGSKHSSENNAFLPRVIHNFTDDGRPTFAQWNYRMLCHPLSFDLPLNRFRIVEDLKSRLVSNMEMADHKKSTRARFQLNPDNTAIFTDSGKFNVLIDKIMREIPGKDNYVGKLVDDGTDGIAVDPEGKEVNSAYYHRKYGIRKRGSTGTIRTIREKAFSDPTLYMAMTSQEKVVPMRDKRCKNDRCGQAVQRWTYAIPVEIVYLTPLLGWNPYNINYKGDASSAEGKTVSDKGQTGKMQNPFDGANSEKNFVMPHEFFFEQKTPIPDNQVVKGAVYVKNIAGKACPTTSSGFRVLSPNMADLGRVRFRYPICPVFEEGSVAFKELEALKDVVLHPMKYNKMLYEPYPMMASVGVSSRAGSVASSPVALAPSDTVLLVTQHSAYPDRPEHTHTVRLTRRQIARMKNGNDIIQESSFADEHTHSFKLEYKKTPSPEDHCKLAANVIVYKTCDGDVECWDAHPRCFKIQEGNI